MRKDSIAIIFGILGGLICALLISYTLQKPLSAAPEKPIFIYGLYGSYGTYNGDKFNSIP